MNDPKAEPKTELEIEAFGPEGNRSRHLALAALYTGLATLPDPPKDLGRLGLIVRRLADGRREEPESVELTAAEGVPGDGWSRRPPRDLDAQLTVMRMDIARLIANGQPVSHFGDNLFVDLDLSAASLPAGTRLRVGEVLVEVTPKPHDGCLKFKKRFGQAALVFVQAPTDRAENRRGMHWRIIEDGRIELGDPIEVISRPGKG